MLQAAIRGKASGAWKSEDALTSLVLGTLALREHHNLLCRFLLDAFQPADADDIGLSSAVIIHTIEFWPKLSRTRIEPDARVDVHRPDGTRHSIFIEAKHLSGLSGEGNQLARQWQAIREEGISDFSLVYLTGDYTSPSNDVADARKLIGTDADRRLRWLSWRSLPRLLRGEESELLQQLREALIKKDLSFFEGWPKCEAIETVSWRFVVPRLVITWPRERLQAIRWSFISPNSARKRGVKI